MTNRGTPATTSSEVMPPLPGLVTFTTALFYDASFCCQARLRLALPQTDLATERRNETVEYCLGKGGISNKSCFCFYTCLPTFALLW